MTHTGRFLRLASFTTPLATGLLVSSLALGALQNRYTFNDGTVTDIIGGQNGELVDPAGIAFFSGGQVHLTNNNGAGSAQDFSSPTATGAYINLPNGLINSASNNGDFWEFSLEFWATVQENRDWARLGDFGNSNGGEDVSGSASMTDYIIVVPRTGGRDNPDETNKFAASTHSLTGQEDVVPDITGDLPVGVQHHIVVTVNQNDLSAGDNGTLNLYLNNALVATGPVEDEGFVDFSFINDVNNWLGRAQWGDPLFDGSYNEFSIYSHALDATEVANNFNAGVVVDAFAFPKLMVDRATGEVSVITESTEPSQLDLLSYSIGSASGSLNPSGWNTIDTGSFDPNGTWSASSTTETSIAESTTGDGGQLPPGSDQPIGTAWNPSPFNDVTFTFTRVGGTPVTGEVVYVGDPIQAADLDADGDIDEDDFNAFAAAAHTDLSGMSAYELYKSGDLDGDGDNDYADWRLFKAEFIAANGAPAFAALIANSVPEPTAALLAAASVVGFLIRRR